MSEYQIKAEDLSRRILGRIYAAFDDNDARRAVAMLDRYNAVRRVAWHQYRDQDLTAGELFDAYLFDRRLEASL